MKLLKVKKHIVKTGKMISGNFHFERGIRPAYT